VCPPRPQPGSCLPTPGERPGQRWRPYTVNHQPWYPGLDPPYVVAIVEIEEQPDLRLMTNVVNCDAEKVRVGMPVRVLFEQHDDVWIPLFEPAA